MKKGSKVKTKATGEIFTIEEIKEGRIWVKELCVISFNKNELIIVSR